MGFIVAFLAFFITSILIPALIIWFIVKLIKASKKSTPTSSSAPTQYSAPAQNTAPAKKLDSAPAAPTPTPKTSELKYFSPDDIKTVNYMDVRQHPDMGTRMGYMTAFAEAGDSFAQHELGEAYYFGNEIVKRDWDKAEDLFLKARSGGAVRSTTFLAMLYFEKMCDLLEPMLEKSETPEIDWLALDPTYDQGAAYLAEALAAYEALAVRIYSRNFSSHWVKGNLGDITIKKTDKALESEIAKLKAQNTRFSHYVLGMFYLRGIGVKSDIPTAKAYLQKAADEGDYSAKFELENPIFADDDDDDE